jgi:hypothetical protein|tara:strand:+ start:82 stop:384 length:303 start_codon:yes stop_codon:yes gene_type:complete
MAHFAELDSNNIVLRIVVISNNDILDGDGNESEAVGSAFCQELYGGRWVQTSYNGNFRKQYAGVGGEYNTSKDIFIYRQPDDSWVLDSNDDWQPPEGWDV